jgi:indolepyruvate ferredoxin oxidoreductase, alpha subunit
MHPLLGASRTRRLLLGNEAIVRGALEAGVGFVSTYPGTPSSEIGDNFHRLHEEAGVGFEYSVNEKVALEVAGATAAAGVRTLVAMKHVGVNVAADPLMTLSYMGVRAGFVLVTADDPGCHSSQNEQDNRHYARLGKLPMLEPATPEDAYRLVQTAFELSEKFETPFLLRTTTRIAHTRGAVDLGDLGERKTRGAFIPDKRRFTPMPAVARLRHPVVEENLAKIEAAFEASDLNRTYGTGELGILTSGVSACYVQDVVRRLGIADRVRVLHLVTTFPAPRRTLADFVGQVDRALVVEEGDTILENELRLASSRAGKLIRVFGKESGHFSPLGELDPDLVAAALTQLLGLETETPADVDLAGLPGRPPILCPSCPHRATFYAVKLALGDSPMYLSDIGCYTLGALPPLNMGDYFICMGSSVSSAGGFAAVTDKPVVAFIGDSTFFHSGMTGLLNSVHNRRDLTLVVLDNSTTGMTGHQPHPGSPVGEYPAADIERIARAAGVEHIATIDPLNTKASYRTVAELSRNVGFKLLISRSPCPLFARKALGHKRPATKYTVDADKCRVCGRAGQGLQCELHPHPDYELARGRARVNAGPETSEDYALHAPAKMEHPPCEVACPLGLCVQGYVNHIAAGRYREARALIRQRLIMPHTVCRVCNHPCEDVCIRGDVDEPIAINRLKRFVMDNESDGDRAAFINWVGDTVLENGMKVAVIGAGPSGLACAFDLRFRGFEVHIFEAEAEAGGLARYGIPAYRLPREALAKDLEMIAGLGVQFHFGVRFPDDRTLDSLNDEGYAAVYLAPGQGHGARLGVEGEELPGVLDALAWLRDVNGDHAERLDGHVVVVGGGNTAVDAARSARRLGATEVTILYRRTRDQMPANKEEIAAALGEGVRLHELARPEELSQNGGSLRILCRRMELSEPGSDGRLRPVPIDQTFEIEADRVIAAIGQMPHITAGFGTALVDSWGRFQADPVTGVTADPFVFVGGDAVTGPSSVVSALQAGKYAAYGIDRVLATDPRKIIIEHHRDRETLLAEPRYQPQNVSTEPRRHIAHLAPDEAVNGFSEVDGALDEAAARAEAARCLACGHCAVCQNCLDNFGCPAFYKEDNRIQINPILCDGCGTCVQVCPNGAIVPVGEVQ